MVKHNAKRKYESQCIKNKEALHPFPIGPDDSHHTRSFDLSWKSFCADRNLINPHCWHLLPPQTSDQHLILPASLL
jgi:hypothetical protein